MSAVMPRLLHLQEDMIELMEADLTAKCTSVYDSSSVKAHVHGIFSLDELEKLMLSDLSGNIGVGCAYLRATSEDAVRPPADRGQYVRHAQFFFIVLLAVPVEQRHNATKLLSLLRRGIAGQTIAGDRANKQWTFVSEAPQIAESTDEVVYYAQVWRADLPVVGKT